MKQISESQQNYVGVVETISCHPVYILLLFLLVLEHPPSPPHLALGPQLDTTISAFLAARCDHLTILSLAQYEQTGCLQLLGHLIRKTIGPTSSFSLLSNQNGMMWSKKARFYHEDKGNNSEQIFQPVLCHRPHRKSGKSMQPSKNRVYKRIE